MKQNQQYGKHGLHVIGPVSNQHRSNTSERDGTSQSFILNQNHQRPQKGRRVSETQKLKPATRSLFLPIE
jgi:hypothetical protein